MFKKWDVVLVGYTDDFELPSPRLNAGNECRLNIHDRRQVLVDLCEGRIYWVKTARQHGYRFEKDGDDEDGVWPNLVITFFVGSLLMPSTMVPGILRDDDQ